MLIFREIDYDKDLEEIIILIQENLDRQITKDFFIWKHLNNPFGKSFGMVALEKDKIVGLRMFMFWNFISKTIDRITAIRPVDTVVHKRYRGKGLFKKMTLKGLEMCQGKYDFVFNTPNENSLPGYLKMGWKLDDFTTNFRLGFINPFSKKHKVHEISLSEIKGEACKSDNLQTFRSRDFIKWRYNAKQYRIFSYADNFIIISTRISRIKNIIIYEAIGNPDLLAKMLNQICVQEKVFYVYYYDNRSIKPEFFFSFKRKQAVVVIREKSKDIPPSDFSLGDLEGKL